MESDLGKLFIGGISWDTDEERLKEYFGNYGEVVEAVIMRDRLTGRARGFGFVVFADPAIAERVTRDKHTIDGRTVEAKKAVPREDQHLLNRSIASSHGSPGPTRTKKIFVGGLASTVTESEFKKYFDQFGNITDVVVMYDHNTQRPRGFGFITYDTEDAVDRVLVRTFHDLSGKMVEVKRAVPKELSPAPNRSPLIGYNYGLSRVNSFLNSYAQGYNLGSIGGYGARVDGRFSPIVSARGAFPPFVNSGYGIGMNMEQGLGPNIGGNSSLGNSSGYGRMTSPYYTENSNRYNTPIGVAGSNRRTDSALNPNGRNLWGNGGYSSAVNLGAYLGSENGGFSSFGNAGGNWGSSISAQDGSTGSSFTNGNIGFWAGDESFGLSGDGDEKERNNSSGVAPGSSFAASADGLEETRGNFYRGSSIYSNSTWGPTNQDIDGSGSLSYGLGSISSNATARGSENYIGNYNAATRQPNRGIAA